MLSEGRFPLARAAVPQAWRGLRVPALSLLSLPGDGVPGAVPSGEGCVRLVLRACPSTWPERIADARGAARARPFSRPEYAWPVRTGCPRRAEIAKSLSLRARRHGRLSRAGFCPQVRKAVFVISICLSRARRMPRGDLPASLGLSPGVVEAAALQIRRA